MSSKTVFGLIGLMFLVMVALYIYLAHAAVPGIVAAIVMLIIAFFFATVSGYLVGMIGSTNNPISGLTLTTLIIAALLMVSLGVSGPGGVAVVLGVAAVACVSSAVAGELLQDFKVGYILGGTPRKIQIAELIAVVVASSAMYWPLYILQAANIKSGGTGFGDPKLSAPQAGLMATLAQGIVGGDMPWPLVVVGVMFGIVMIMVKVRSPMLVAVGMYLPINTTFAIFIGGMFRWVTDSMRKKAGLNEAQKARVENVGILTASGLIAGESLMGLVIAAFRFFEWPLPKIFPDPSYLFGTAVILLLGVLLVRLPLANAGHPDEPAPPRNDVTHGTLCALFHRGAALRKSVKHVLPRVSNTRQKSGGRRITTVNCNATSPPLPRLYSIGKKNWPPDVMILLRRPDCPAPSIGCANFTTIL